jgi:acyl carrier protein
MDRQEILETIKEHLAGRGIEREKVTPEAEVLGDLDLDSLDTVELTLGLEEKFGIEIPDTDLEDVTTINDAIDLIEQKVAVKT